MSTRRNTRRNTRRQRKRSTRRSTRRSGGATLSKPLRTEYMALTKQLLDGIDTTPRLFEIIRDAAEEHIATLPAAAQPTLREQLAKIFASTAAVDEPNLLAHLNVTALQVAMMFTVFYMRMPMNNLESFWKERGMNNHMYRFPGVNSAQEGTYEGLEDIDWTDYQATKAFAAGRNHLNTGEGLKDILFPQTAPKRYVAFLGFLTLREIVDAMLHEVYYVGLSFAPQYVDASMMSPTAYLLHDIEHAFDGLEMDPKIQNDMIEFLTYVNTLPAPRQYSVYFILFYMLHEGGKKSVFYPNNNRYHPNPISITSHYTSTDDLHTFIYNSTTKFMDGFVRTIKFGSAIPAAYRIPAQKRYHLQRDKVLEYVTLAVDRYVEAWAEFMKQQGRSFV